MRRIAVLLVLTAALGGACNRPLLLPSDLPDGGSATGSGGATSSGGAPAASGGRSGSGGGAAAGSFGGGGKPGGMGGNNGMPGFCGETQELGYRIQRAKVVFALGRNASMSSPFGNSGAMRLSAVQQAIRAVVSANQRAVAFGYEDFPAAAGGCQNGSTCCANTGTVPVFPSLSNYALIDSALMWCDVSSGPSGCVFQSASRPLADVLRNVQLDPLSTTDQRLILLVDGPPGCSSEDMGVSCSNALNQLSQLSARVRIHVIPIGVEAEQSACLKSIALQGDPDGTTAQPFVYRAADPMQLMQSLFAIVSDVSNAACIIQVFQVPADTRGVSLEIKRMTVPRDQGNGWSFVPGSSGTMEVRGSWCEALKDAAPREVAVYNCR